MKNNTALLKTLLAGLALCAVQATLPMNLNEQLFEAVKRGDLNEVTRLIQAGANVNAADKYGDTVLIQAEMANNEPITRLLIENGANVNATNEYRNTALTLAARNGREPIARLLIENGANVNAADANGHTALILAAVNGRETIARLLIQNGADMNAASSYKNTALIAAATEGSEPIVELLLTHIPPADVQTIQNAFTGFLVLKKMETQTLTTSGQHRPPLLKDVRRYLISPMIIKNLVEEQMQRIDKMVAHKHKEGNTARDRALIKLAEANDDNERENLQAIADMLDINNPENPEPRNRLRKEIENNIRRILFAPRPPVKQESQEENPEPMDVSEEGPEPMDISE